jgi:phospholipase/carboxylesterase
MSMRAFALTAAAALGAGLGLGACGSATADGDGSERRPAASAQSDTGRLTARPRGGGGNCAPGEHRLTLGSGRIALMRVTAGGRRGKALVLALHGAGSGGARGGLYALRGGWSFPGVVMVAPSAGGSTWSFFQGRDEDLPFVNRALARAFARCRVDPQRIAVGGFSDGATYALTLGLRNGDLFRAVVALSPGGVLAENAIGKPRVFIAHGTLDNVLPIERTSDVIVRELRTHGYRVTYRRFRGGHEARPEISRVAFRWFLGR